jgi:hypothetical protein
MHNLRKQYIKQTRSKSAPVLVEDLDPFDEVIEIDELVPSQTTVFERNVPLTKLSIDISRTLSSPDPISSVGRSSSLLDRGKLLHLEAKYKKPIYQAVLEDSITETVEKLHIDLENSSTPTNEIPIVETALETWSFVDTSSLERTVNIFPASPVISSLVMSKERSRTPRKSQTSQETEIVSMDIDPNEPLPTPGPSTSTGAKNPKTPQGNPKPPGPKS